MLDEELMMFFLCAVYLLEQNKQIRIRGIMSAALAARNIQMQIAVIGHFVNDGMGVSKARK